MSGCIRLNRCLTGEQLANEQAERRPGEAFSLAPRVERTAGWQCAYDFQIRENPFSLWGATWRWGRLAIWPPYPRLTRRLLGLLPQPGGFEGFSAISEHVNGGARPSRTVQT